MNAWVLIALVVWISLTEDIYSFPRYSSFISKYVIVKSQNSKLFSSPFIEKIPVSLSFEDMRQWALILNNVTDHIDINKPEVALSEISKHMGWLYSRDIPKLTEMLMKEFPEIREFEGVGRAYRFILDFLEVVAKETNTMMASHQLSIKKLLEASKISEKAIDKLLEKENSQFTSSDFLVFLDCEIESQEENSPMQNLLVTIKLRILDEIGRNLGVDVMILPKLASEGNPAELKRKTVEHLKSYDRAGKELFLQTLQIMRGEMKRRYNNVDPLLSLNLEQIEKIAKGLLDDSI